MLHSAAELSFAHPGQGFAHPEQHNRRSHPLLAPALKNPNPDLLYGWNSNGRSGRHGEGSAYNPAGMWRKPPEGADWFQTAKRSRTPDPHTRRDSEFLRFGHPKYNAHHFAASGSIYRIGPCCTSNWKNNPGRTGQRPFTVRSLPFRNHFAFSKISLRVSYLCLLTTIIWFINALLMIVTS